MHYDPASDELSLLRSKEEADDYRYFPEPDLVPVEPDPAHLDALRAALTELPLARIARLQATYGLAEATAETLALDDGLTTYFEDVAARTGDAQGERQLGHGRARRTAERDRRRRRGVARHARAAGRR